MRSFQRPISTLKTYFSSLRRLCVLKFWSKGSLDSPIFGEGTADEVSMEYPSTPLSHVIADKWQDHVFPLLQGWTRRTMRRDVWSAGGGRDGGGGESWRRWWTSLGGLLAMAMAMSCLLPTLPGAEANPDAKRLYDDLLSNYNRLIRPVGNNSDRLTVKMGLRLSQLIDVVSNHR